MTNPTDASRRSKNATNPDAAAAKEGREDPRTTDPYAPSEKNEKILADAERRDDQAELRDVESDKRSEAADLQAFLDTDSSYAGPGERRAAAVDRNHAKSDRESSAADRAQLSEHETNPD
ncbi:MULTISPECIES: hypothetical protein [Cryobacterium]|uniref:hypothetical protein n=1 Tax=Cryobacterium TaxID=69578 RepID=UPI000CD45C24|nr:MULTISPECIES: hypothetical protein [Cryobacterium]POH67788.1 hypothetical protein C3B60_06090 [Cryobacterium zongtaii]TFC47789.1 hypothetical protein E3O57_02290 [Cryobacterium sp. TMN-39-2]